MKTFLSKYFVIILLALVFAGSIGGLVYVMNRSNEDATNIVQTTEDRYTGKRDGKYFIDGTEVDEKMYDAYLSMMSEDEKSSVDKDSDGKTLAEKETKKSSGTKKSEKKSEQTTDKKKKTNKEVSDEKTVAGQQPTPSDKPASNDKKPSAQTQPSTQAPSTTQATTQARTTEAPTPSPTCSHDWVEITTKVHHDAVTDIVYHDAIYYDIYCFDCGQYILDRYTPCTAEPSYYEKHHFHSGNYSGTSKVYKEAWEEEVVVKDAYDEEVGTGVYKCSKCGVKK